jgi:hypothetical protein
MKKILFLLLCTCFVITVNAQIHKAFLSDEGGSVDSAHASSYILYNKIDDTTWMMKLYGMNDTIAMIGSYKDPGLTIQNGKFTYYQKASTKGMKLVSGSIDTLNHVRTTGFFINGVKTGVWTDYFANGQIEFLKTYKNNQLNGLVETYNYDTNTVLVRGNNIDDKNEGEWDMLDPHGNIVEVDIYKNNQVISTKTIPTSFVGAVPPVNFYDYINHKIGNVISSSLNVDMFIGFSITTDGKLTDPNIISGKLNPETDKKIIEIFNNSPVWKPAYNKTNGQFLKDDVGMVTIKASDGKIVVEYLGNDALKGRFYQLTH